MLDDSVISANSLLWSPRIERYFPQEEVPENQILLSFNGDSDATDFLDWWNAKGVKEYTKYRDRSK